MSNKTSFITEDYLRGHFGLAFSGEIQLPVKSKLTPAAQELISNRKITVRYVDEVGQVFAKNDNDFAKFHPLKRFENKSNNILSTKKPSELTHLNDCEMVSKHHPRIILRGKFDSCISYCVVVQTELYDLPTFIQSYLSDIRSYLGNILQAEVTEKEISLPYLGEFAPDVYHKWSHNPLKHLGHDHIVPNKDLGVEVAKLNYLRALVRELEVLASLTFTENDKITRLDIIAGLNRLSSAVYVVMILLRQYQLGNKNIIQGLSNGIA